ncbi:MAG: hypothetical protein K9J51_04890 [Desulfotignum sp.]|nr:hypothetical protein [Desulfotignum sp.]
MEITITQEIKSELEYMIDLHQEHGAPNPRENLEELITYILSAVAEGSRRPGSWERDLVEKMGLIADTEKHHEYRMKHGAPGKFDHKLVKKFWGIFDRLNLDDSLNHSGDPEEIALNFQQFREKCLSEGEEFIDMHLLKKYLPTSSHRPLLEKTRSLWDRLNKKTVRCWVFKK